MLSTSASLWTMEPKDTMRHLRSFRFCKRRCCSCWLSQIVSQLSDSEILFVVLTAVGPHLHGGCRRKTEPKCSDLNELLPRVTHAHKDTQRYTKTHTHKDTRHKHTQTHKHTNTHTETHTHRETERHTHTYRDTHRDAHTQRERDTYTHTERARHIHTQRDRERERERHT